MFVKGEEKLIAGYAILRTVLVDALDCLTQNTPIQRVGIVVAGGVVLSLSYVEGKAAKTAYLVEESIRKIA